MRVIVPSASAGAISRRDNPDRERNQPDLRLVGRDFRAEGLAGPRLAVIVAADMVDYTRHMANDEAGTYAFCLSLDRNVVRPELARHCARLIKQIGDGFLAEFSSATAAVWFAVRFQDMVRARNARRLRAQRYEFRIGINLGDVIVEGDDVFGHSVNIASRLESRAMPGGVLVSHAVFASVRDKRLRFEDAGDLSLKNVGEPVRCFHARLSATRKSRGKAKGGWGEQRGSNP